MDSKGVKMQFTEKEGRIAFQNTDGISYDTWLKIFHKINHLGYGMPDVDSIKEYFDRGYPLQPDQSIAVKEVFNKSHSKPKNTKTAEKDTAKAIKHFGLTENWKLAGYLLTDGQMLNFSYDGYMRDMDHRDIKDVITHDGTYNGALIKFVNYGHIRVMQTGFELSKQPTEKQRKTLSRCINRLEDLYVDISNNDGHIVKHMEYHLALPSEVLRDIDGYFDMIG